MALNSSAKVHPPQAFISSYAPRLRQYGNSLIQPIVPPANQLPPTRTTKRGTTAINYAEDEFGDDDFDSEGPRRPTGLRSLRRDESQLDPSGKAAELGKELMAPVEVQGVWREWMGKPKRGMTEKQLQIQSVLPLTLIPIRIDLDVNSFRPEPALPMPQNLREWGIDDTLPAYKPGEPTPSFRLKDAFLWNLHEALMTPDQFAKVFVDELDFPSDRKPALVMTIAGQIRQQLEEYAGVALHPLFHTATPPSGAVDPAPKKAVSFADVDSARQSATPLPTTTNGTAPATPNGAAGEASTQATAPADAITASAKPIAPTDDIHNPDDTYRCIIHLNINLLNRLYSDKFEWSLLHPPGFAEVFAKQTCADLGLSGEWVPAMAHAIYEAVLKLKKEACENGGLMINADGMDNDCVEGEAGWRYDPEHLADEWEPKVEILSKEEIEKREGDRERQIRRLRRETARFSSTTNMPGDFGTPAQGGDEERMGRGERSKKKRRFRSLSPEGRDTPGAGDKGFGGVGGGLQEWERQNWRCAHCFIWGSAVWAVRDGPAGPRTLCHNCGYLYERDKRLPPWNRELYAKDKAFGTR